MPLLDIDQLALRIYHPFSYRHLTRAHASVAQHSGRKTTWDGPKDGPKAAQNKRLVILAADMGNAGISGVIDGIKEAAEHVGWELSVVDGGGTAVGRTAVFSKALTLEADGIVINGFDAMEQKAGISLAQQANIPIVSWHASQANGPDHKHGIFANITTNTQDVAETAALWAYADAKAKPGVVIITDTTYQIAINKSEYIHELLYRIGAEVIDFLDMPIATAHEDMAQTATELWQKYGKQWTHTIAINDIYFDTIADVFHTMGLAAKHWPKGIAAGDGSLAAYQRIREGLAQQITIAEPLNLQGWQIIDEMNRAFHNDSWSAYQTPLHLVTAENIDFDGGKEYRFEPDNHYREKYLKIWL